MAEEIEKLAIKEKLVRGCKVFTIDTRPLYKATKISQYNRSEFGRYTSRVDAVAKMNNLLAAYNGKTELTTDIKFKVITVGDALNGYLSGQKLSMTASYYSSQELNLRLLKEAIYKDIKISHWNIQTISSKSEREDFRDFVENLILNEGKSIETMFNRRKHMTKFFQAAAKKGLGRCEPSIRY